TKATDGLAWRGGLGHQLADGLGELPCFTRRLGGPLHQRRKVLNHRSYFVCLWQQVLHRPQGSSGIPEHLLRADTRLKAHEEGHTIGQEHGTLAQEHSVVRCRGGLFDAREQSSRPLCVFFANLSGDTRELKESNILDPSAFRVPLTPIADGVGEMLLLRGTQEAT